MNRYKLIFNRKDQKIQVQKTQTGAWVKYADAIREIEYWKDQAYKQKNFDFSQLFGGKL